MARMKSGGAGGSGSGGGSGQNSQDLSGQLVILQQISQLYDQVNDSLQFQKSALEEILILNKEICENICVSNYSNLNESIRGISDSFDNTTKNAKLFSDTSSRLNNNIKQNSNSFNQFSNDVNNANKELDKLTESESKFGKFGNFLSGIFGNIGDSLSGMAAAAGQSIFNIIGSLGKLTFAIMASPFMIMNKMFEIAGSNTDNSFALALEEVREEFGNLREGMAKDVIDIHREMISDTRDLVGMSAFRIFGENRAEILQEALKTVKALGGAARPFIDTFGKDAVVKLALFQKGLGLSEEATKNLADVAMNSGKDISDVTTELTKMSNAMGRAIGESPKVISRAVGEAMKDLGTFGGATIKELAKSEAYLRKLGTTMEEVKGIMSTFETLDTASENAAKLAQSFGVTVDAFELMQMQDPGQMIDSLRKSFKEAGVDTSKFTRQQHSLLAEITGLDAQTAASTFSINRQGESFDKLGKKADEASKKQMSEKDALNSIADSIKRLVPQGEQMSGIMDAFFKGFSTGIQRTAEWRNTMRTLRRALNDVRRAGIEVGIAFVKYFPGIKDILGGLTEMFQRGSFRKFTQGFSKDLRQFFKDLSEGKQSFPQLYKKLKDKFFGYFDASNPGAKKMLAGIKKTLKAFSQIFAGIIVEVSKSLAEGIKNIGKGGAIDKGVQETGNTIGFIFSELYAPVLGAIWEALGNIFGAIFSRLNEALGNKVKELGQSFYNFITGGFIDYVKKGFESAGNGMARLALVILGGAIGIKILASIFGPVTSLISSLFSFGFGGGKGADKAAKSGLSLNWKSIGITVLAFAAFLLIVWALMPILTSVIKSLSKFRLTQILSFGVFLGTLIGTIFLLGKTLSNIGEIKLSVSSIAKLFGSFGIFLFLVSNLMPTMKMAMNSIKGTKLGEILNFGIFTSILAGVLFLVGSSLSGLSMMKKIDIAKTLLVFLGFGAFLAGLSLLVVTGLLQLVVAATKNIKPSDIDSFAYFSLALIGLIAALGLVIAGLSLLKIKVADIGKFALISSMLVVIAGVAWVVAKLLSDIELSILPKAIDIMFYMVPLILVSGLVAKILSSLKINIAGVLASLVAVAGVLLVAGGTIAILGEYFSKNNITQASMLAVVTGLIGMIPVLMSMGLIIPILSTVGGAIIASLGTAVPALLAALLATGVVIAAMGAFVILVSAMFKAAKITQQDVDLVTSSLQGMVLVLIGAAAAMAAMGAGSVIGGLGGAIGSGLGSLFGVDEKQTNPYEFLKDLVKQTFSLVEEFRSNNIQQAEVESMISVLDSMLLLVTKASGVVVAMGASSAVGGVGGAIGKLGNLLGVDEKQTNPLAFLKYLVDETFVLVNQFKANPIAESDLKFMSDTLDTMLALVLKASGVIAAMGASSAVGGIGGIIGGLGEWISGNETNPMDLLNKLMGVVFENVEQIKKFNVDEKGLNSFKAFGLAMDAVGSLVEVAGDFISNVSFSAGIVASDGLDVSKMLSSINDIIYTMLGDGGIKGIIDKIALFAQNIGKSESSEAGLKLLVSALDAVSKIVSVLGGGAGDVAMQIAKTLPEDKASEIGNIMTQVSNSTTSLMHTTTSSIMMIITVIGNLVKSFASLNLDPKAAEAIGSLIGSFATLIQAITPSPEVLNALKTTVTQKVTGYVFKDTETVVNKFPFDEFKNYMTTIFDVIKPFLTEMLGPGGPLSSIISMTSGMSDKQIEGLKVVADIMKTFSSIIDMVKPDPKVLENLRKPVDGGAIAQISSNIASTEYFKYLNSMGSVVQTMMNSLLPILNTLLTSAKELKPSEIKRLQDITKIIETILGFLSTLSNVAKPETVTEITKSGVGSAAIETSTTKVVNMVDSISSFSSVFAKDVMPKMYGIIRSLLDENLIPKISGDQIKRINNISTIITTLSEIFTKFTDINKLLSGDKVDFTKDKEVLKKELKDKIDVMSDVVAQGIWYFIDPKSGVGKAISAISQDSFAIFSSTGTGSKAETMKSRLTNLSTIADLLSKTFTSLKEINDSIADDVKNGITFDSISTTTGQQISSGINDFSSFSLEVNKAFAEKTPGADMQSAANNLNKLTPGLKSLDTFFNTNKDKVFNIGNNANDFAWNLGTINKAFPKIKEEIIKFKTFATQDFATLVSDLSILLSDSSLLGESAGYTDIYSSDLVSKAEAIALAAGAMNSTLVSAYKVVSEVGKLKADIELGMQSGNLLGADYKYKVEAPGVNISLDVNVTMNAGEVEYVMAQRKDSIIRGAINHLNREQKSITDASSKNDLLPRGFSKEIAKNKLNMPK